MSQYTTISLPASKPMENPLPRWPGKFPLAGAVYIEFLAKKGHFVNEDDRLEARQRNDKLRVGSKASTHNSRVDWLDEKFPRQDMSRYAMDTISMLGVRATPSLNRHFSGSYPQDQISTEAAKEIINTYNKFWMNYQSPAITGSSSLPKHHECVAQHMERFGTYGHNMRSTGCRGGEAGIDDWEVVDEPGEGEWTEVTQQTDGEV